MAEDAGEPLAARDRSNPSAAPKSIGQIKAEIAETRNRIAARPPSTARPNGCPPFSAPALSPSAIGRHPASEPSPATLSTRFGVRVTDLPSVDRPNSPPAPDWSPLPASHFC
jgi:hypothetical protein